LSPAALAPIWVMGAGSVGVFIGGRLAAAGATVRFIGRTRIQADIRQHGLHLSDLEASTRELRAEQIDWQLEPVATELAPGLVLLCVKSLATAQAATALARVLPPGTRVLSLQNGVDNAAVAARAAPGLKLLAGMVPFNVAELGPGRFHRGSSGQLAVQDDALLRQYPSLFAAAGLPLALHPDLRTVQWAKLLLNLNNPVNALSGLALREQLLHPGWRRCSAALMAEALRVLAAAGIAPARLTPLPARAIPLLMRLPTPLFRLAAARMLRIDPKARSSMADDLDAGREPEIDALCGAVMRLGAGTGVATPRNAAMLKLMQARVRLPLEQVQRALL
jgi:2-dehydropantoate 2-reductase